MVIIMLDIRPDATAFVRGKLGLLIKACVGHRGVSSNGSVVYMSQNIIAVHFHIKLISYHLPYGTPPPRSFY
jgi:hypothetical protein